VFAGRRIASAADTAEVFRETVDLDRERFSMLHLAANGRPLAVEVVSQGNLNSSIAHPREIFKNALQLGTKKVAFVHNHPSGDPMPSPEDLSITDRLKAVGELIGIDAAYHVVVGAEGYADVTSFQTAGWREPSTERRRQLREVAGRLVRQKPEVPWSEVFDRKVNSGYDAAAVGLRLLDPGDRVAVALALDNKHRLIGVYPIAYEHIDQRALTRAAEIATGTSSAALVLVTSRDGPEWQAQSQMAHEALTKLGELVGVRYLDTVSVGASGAFLSMVDDDSLVWGSR
jgi:DNA repair protein RadC